MKEINILFDLNSFLKLPVDKLFWKSVKFD